MAGLLWHSVDPMTPMTPLSAGGDRGRCGLRSGALRPLLLLRLGEAGDGGVPSDTATGSPAGRTCWKADLTTSMASSASEPESLWFESALRCEEAAEGRLRRGGGDEVRGDVLSGATTSPRGEGWPTSGAALKAECGDLCSRSAPGGAWGSAG